MFSFLSSFLVSIRGFIAMARALLRNIRRSAPVVAFAIANRTAAMPREAWGSNRTSTRMSHVRGYRAPIETPPAPTPADVPAFSRASAVFSAVAPADVPAPASAVSPVETTDVPVPAPAADDCDNKVPSNGSELHSDEADDMPELEDINSDDDDDDDTCPNLQTSTTTVDNCHSGTGSVVLSLPVVSSGSLRCSHDPVVESSDTVVHLISGIFLLSAFWYQYSKDCGVVHDFLCGFHEYTSFPGWAYKAAVLVVWDVSYSVMEYQHGFDPLILTNTKQFALLA